MPGEEVAKRLGISLNAVYLTTSRLCCMIQQEINRIDPDCPPCMQLPRPGPDHSSAPSRILP